MSNVFFVRFHMLYPFSAVNKGVLLLAAKPSHAAARVLCKVHGNLRTNFMK
jgi:hypothetical protein